LAQVAFHDLQVGEDDLIFLEVDRGQSEDLHEENFEDFGELFAIQLIALDLRLDLAELGAQLRQLNLFIRGLLVFGLFLFLYFYLAFVFVHVLIIRVF
jgi:hypothetical protein